MVRPKIFLDTNICIDVASGKICPAEWRLVQKYISMHYRYYVSFITWKELLTKLNRGSDDYFERNKGPLRVLCGPAKRYYLPYPSVFAIRTVLGIKNVGRIHDFNCTEEEVMQKVTKAVFDAPNKTQLKHGIRSRTWKKRILTFDLDHFDTQENGPQKEYAKILHGIREGTTDDKPERKKFAAWILRPHGLTPYTKDCEKLASALDAAYCFTVALSKFAKNKKYDFKTHASNWDDTQQLLYLSDESMHFLTQDADFHNRITNSPQCCRILNYRKFVKSIGESVAVTCNPNLN